MNALLAFLIGFSAFTGCNEQNKDSNVNFASDSLGKYSDTDFFDIKLKPKPIYADEALNDRSLDLSQSLFELRFFRIYYRNNVPLDQPLEGDIVKVEDEGGSVITVDKFSDGVIEITTALENHKEIIDGHYAAVICPISVNRTKDCLNNLLPLTTYKEEVQAGRCGKISNDNSSLDERCKKLLFAGSNTFMAIAYPLTAQNNKFISGDKEMVYIKSNSLSLAGNEQDLNPKCVAEIDKMPFNGLASVALNGVCKPDKPSVPNSLGKVPNNVDQNNIGKQPPYAPPPMVYPAPRLATQPPLSNPSQLPPRIAPPPPPMAPPMAPPPPMAPAYNPYTTYPPFPNDFPSDFEPKRFNNNPFASTDDDCFLAGTKILGVRGDEFQNEQSNLEELEIQSIQAGDWVFNPLTHALYKVSKLNIEKLSKGKMVYQIDSSSIKVTGVHPVIRSNGYDTIAALFKNADQSSRQDSLLYASEGKLSYRSVTVSRQVASEDSQIFNVVTDASQSVELSSKAIDLEGLPEKFNCTAENNKACLYYLAVIDDRGQFLVAGDLVKQRELHSTFAYFSNLTYNASIGQ